MSNENEPSGFGMYLKRSVILSFIVGIPMSIINDMSTGANPISVNIPFSIFNFFTLFIMLSVCIFYVRRINILKAEGRRILKVRRKRI